MEECGVVISTSRGKARVRMEPAEKCVECHGCLLSPSERLMVAEVTDQLGAFPGDRVRVRTQGVKPLRAGILLLGFPLALLFAGYTAGGALAHALGIAGAAQDIGIALGALFFFGSYGLQRLFPGGKARAERSAIVEIL